MPIQQWRITQVGDMDAVPGEAAWVITYEQADGDGRFVAVLLKESVEIRAAEYGLASVDEALEVILYEPLLASAQASGELDMLTPSLLDVEAARQQVTEQIAACKERYGVITTTAAAGAARLAQTTDPLQVIRDQTRIDPIKAAAIRMEMDRYRLAYAAELENGEGR